MLHLLNVGQHHASSSVNIIILSCGADDELRQKRMDNNHLLLGLTHNAF